MPRYCAVKLCKNRGGVPSKDNKKISFYPFPLRDEARLQKWVDNMRRQEWTPSRHQYLCSEHFTEDSFDLRWGIRYLKHTAIPTIFPFIYGQDEPPVKGKLSRIQERKKTRPKTSQNFKKRCINLEEQKEAPCEVSEAKLPVVLLLRDAGPHISSLSALGNTSASLVEQSFVTEHQLIAPCEQSLLPEALPSAPSDPQSCPVPPSIADWADEPEQEFSGTEHSLLGEHSYSRQDRDKNQLWSKIVSLLGKMTELEKQEQGTVARINFLENTVAQLRKENIACEEKQKALENYFTSVFL